MFGVLKREKTLARLIAAAIERRELVKIAPRLGLMPLPGRRLKTMTPMEHALLLARASRDPAATPALLHAVTSALPAPLFPASDAPELERWLSIRDELPLSVRVRFVLYALKDPANGERVARAVDDGFLDEVAGANESPAPEAKPARREPDPGQIVSELETARAAAAAAIAARDAHRTEANERIEELRRELADVQKRLGVRNQDAMTLEKTVRELKADVAQAQRKAADSKRALEQARAPSTREADLAGRLERERQRADIEASKVELLEYQLDLLEQPEEKERERPPPKPNDPLPGRIAEFTRAHGRRPRILVLGGAGKQRSHLEVDFTQMKEHLGIDGEWRLADYTSWHRELPRLKNDLRGRFDLLFVLHWNRTTFVQKMHDEARAAGTRARTVSYRGFLSLERAVREEIDRWTMENL